MLEPGANVGRYTLEARLGRGGGGEVWSARDPALGRRVALKFLRGEDPSELARFEREAKAAAGLSHPGIAAVYEVGVAEGAPFIAMQLIDGGTLRSKPLDARNAVRCVRDAARALQYAHDNGVIHRDLKPDNLLVDSAGRVFVSDFGLARVGSTGSTLTAEGAVLGTPAYMPPEQARGDVARVGAASDIYSLGATLFHLLAGKPPFAGATAYEIITSVIQDEPPAPPGDPALIAVVLKCLEKDPARRYATMAALADDLDRWLGGEAVSATLPSLRQRLGKRRGAVGVAGVLVAVLIAAVVVVRQTRATGEAATALTVAALRQKADVCLKAALDLRRSGNAAGMEQYVNELNAACDAFAAADPSSPEPHYLRGRMLRAQLSFGKAEREQEAALARDPRHARARYERLIVRAHRVRFAITDAEAEGRLRLAVQPEAAGTVRLSKAGAELMASVAAEAAALAREPGLEAGERLCARALGAWAARRAAEARDAAAAAVAAQAELDEAYQLLGDSEYELGRLDEAIAAYAAGSAADPGALTLRFSHAQRRYERARKAAAAAEIEAVERELGEVAALDASARHALSLRADATMERARLTGMQGGDAAPVWRLAVIRFEEALRGEPDEPSLSTGLGLAYANEALGRMLTGLDPRDGFDAAIRSLERTVSLHPGYAAAWNALGVARLNLATWGVGHGSAGIGEFEEAARDFTKAAALDPGDARFLEWRAKARMNAAIQADDYDARFRAALEDLARVPGSEPTRGLLHYNWARREQRAGRDPAPRYREALEALASAEGPEALFARGNVHLALGKAEEAAADFSAVIAKNSAHDEAWAGRARANADRGTFEDAEADGVRATQLNPKRADNWFALGLARRANGVAQFRARRDPREAFRGAIAAFTRVLEVRPSDAGALTNRASTRHALGRANEGLKEPALEDYRAAMADYRKAVEFDPAAGAKLKSVMETCERDIERNQ